MRRLLLILMAYSLGICACKYDNQAGTRIFDSDKLIAWCIVPFDAEQRTPLERAAMLRELGLRHFAYDYRKEHIPSFKEEVEILRTYGIGLDAVWLWVDPSWNEIINDDGRQILDILGETGTTTEIWLGFPESAFEGPDHDQGLSRTLEVVKEILLECEKLGCTLALYNHGGWFGEPENLVRIVEAVGSDKLKIVYNFHHGHHQVMHFRENLEKMLPYLSTININGMRVEGPKIITLGEGDLELEMLRTIMESAYKGTIGILGHTEGEDIALVLERNLKGLEQLKQEL